MKLVSKLTASLALFAAFTFLPTPAFSAQEGAAIDTVTVNRFENFVMKARLALYDESNRRWQWDVQRDFSDVFDRSNFDKEDLCIMQQFSTVMEVLNAHPELANRLSITLIQVDYLLGTSRQLAKHDLAVELFNDPWLRVEAGVKTDVPLGSRRSFCVLQNSQRILSALQSIATNH